MTLAASEQVQVRLQYATPTDAVWEEDAAAWFAAHAGDRPDPYDQEGSIFVSAGSRSAQVHDQLLHLIPTCCFDAVARVLAGDVVEFRLASAETAVRLAAMGDEIEIVSNVMEARRFPRLATLEGLVACGERSLALLQSAWAGLDYDEALADIARQGQQARQALEAARAG